MNQPQSDFVIAKSRAQFNAGYLPGFGNDFETEAVEGALPIGRNSPQRCPYGLYAKCEGTILPAVNFGNA